MTAPAEPKKLYRNTQDQMVAGVCSGIAEFFGLDVTLVRVAYALITLVLTAFFGGVLAYLVMWFLIPAKPTGPQPPGAA